MKTFREQMAELKAAMLAVVDGAKAEGRDLTDDEATDIETKGTEYKVLEEKAQRSERVSGMLTDLARPSEQPATPDGDEAKADEPATVGERFVKSAGFKSFRESHPSGVGSGTPIRIEAKAVGHAADLVGAKATITTQTGSPGATRLPGYRSTLLDEPFTFLDLITVGVTESSWLEYAQIIAETDNAAVVAEGELKPLSDVTTTKAEAKAYTYADGFDVTNQTLADDGALVAFLDSRIRYHVRNKVEDVILNGDAGSAVKGIMNTTGVQAQAFDTDVITTLAAAMQKVEAVQVEPQAIVMNPADAWKLALTKEANVGYVLGNPLQQGLNPTPFGVRLVKSNRVAAGTALVGNFSSVQFLEREPLSVVAFNQHKDYAQRNMSYVRAELRGLQLIYSPRDIVVADLTAA